MQAVEIHGLSHSYPGKRRQATALALNDVRFSIPVGKFFAIVGPNGGGKSTLFKLISTLAPIQKGSISVLGKNVQTEPEKVRPQLGVVFQSPALDKKLTVEENLKFQARLYGVKEIPKDSIERLGLGEVLGKNVETLSGGYKRRVEIAKALLHRPTILLLDEPTTGLDPAIRREVWSYLKNLQSTRGMTVIVTTHFLDEAEKCDGVAMLHKGRLIAQDSPQRLTGTIGGDVILLKSQNAKSLSESIEKKFQISARCSGEEIWIEKEAGHEFIPSVVSAFPGQFSSVMLRKPTLEDYFVQVTGKQYGEEVTV